MLSQCGHPVVWDSDISEIYVGRRTCFQTYGLPEEDRKYAGDTDSAGVLTGFV